MIGTDMATTHIEAGAHSAHRQRRSPVVAAAWVTLFAAFALGACSGDNLFSGDGRGQNPRVDELEGPPIAEAGTTIQITVSATAPRGVREILLSLTGATVLDTVIAVGSSPQTINQTISIPLPAPFTDSVIVASAAIVDASGVVSAAETTTMIAFATAAPEITIIAPGEGATFPLGDSILVRARIVDPTGIRAVRMHGFSVRQDSASDTEIVQRFEELSVAFPQPPQVALPRDTTIVRFLIATPDTVSETVEITVEAEDSLGHVSMSTVNIGVGGPRVEIRTPANGSQVQVGGTLVVQAFAVDRANGIDSMKVFVSGAQDSLFVWRNLASPDSVKRDTSLVVGTTTGPLNITAAAWSRIGNEGSTAQPVTVEVVNTQVNDTEPPRVALSLTQTDRVELDDSIQVTVTAEDAGSAGLERMGVVMIALPDTSTLTPDTIVVDSIFAASRTGQIDRTFHIRLADFPFEETDQALLPRRFTLQIHAFAVDTVGNVSANTTASLTAGPAQVVDVGPTVLRPATTGYVHEGTSGLQQVVTAVLGSSVALPTGGNIAHAVVDGPNQRLYLSNLPQNRIEVLNLADTTFAPSVQVGSEPWGLFMNNGGDTLIVANSGGTNVSFVDLSTMTEHTQRRLLTPNSVLFEVESSVSNGLIRYSATFYDFSDRPQFIAQDNTGVLLYSTKPTGTAQEGTVRWVDPVGTTPEVRILFNQRAVQEAENTFAIAHIDSLQIQPRATADYLIRLFDHIPGNPTNVIMSSFNTIEAAILELRGMGSDVDDYAGAWIPENVGLSDTTYVAASGDREFIGFGEGGVGVGGRIMLWNASDRSVSNEITVADLVNNASEEVLGLGLDSDGRIGVARGTVSTYFFSNGIDQAGDLRLQGVFSDGVAGGEGGAALHPDHIYSDGSTEETLAFVATANRTIKVVDTFHFFERGEIAIRDRVVGQLRASLPFPGENAGLAATDPDYILVKLYGVTDRDAVVIVNVRNKDLTN